MAGRGETVKYVIDADTSGFTRGMAEAAAESKIAGTAISRNLDKGSKGAENNFKDIRKNAATAASQIRNFGVALQGFNLTSIIIGVTALTGAIIELSGALAAAGSTATILLPALVQGAAAVATFQTGVSGLGMAWKAIQKNDGKAFTQSLANLGPAATQVAYAMGGLNKAFNGIRLNVQNALFDGLAKRMLELGSTILPTVNAGMQRVAFAMNDAAKNAANLMSNPMFGSLLATIFADTARNISVLSGALGPLLSIFTNLYLVARPYVTLLAQEFVNLTKNAAAYLSTVRGQAALNIAIQEGLIAIKEIGQLAGAVFHFLVSLFATSVNSGNSLIVTLTGIIRNMTAWVNSANGQAKLIALFNFTSKAIDAVAGAVGRSLNTIFTMVQIIDSLNPAMQGLIFNFLATSLTLRPLITYFAQLWLAIRTLAVTVFNFGEQMIVVFGALGAAASIVLVLGAAFIILGAIIKGPLGGALLIIGFAIAAYVGLSYLASLASQSAASSFFEAGVAAMFAAEEEAVLSELNVLVATTMYNTAIAAADAGVGMSLAARGAMILQAALIPLIVLAAGVLLILSMLGVFSNKSKQASGAGIGLGNSLGALQKSMKGVGSTGNKAINQGIAPMSDALNNVGDAAQNAQGQLAAFDKMNVLQDPAAAGGANSGIPNLPSLPNFDGTSLGAPTLDTGAFDKALQDMQDQLGGLQKQLKSPFQNPFDALGKWIDSHPWIGLAIFGTILAVVIALFAVFGFAAIAAVIGVGATIGLIVLAVIAVIAIIILLWKNWDTVWGFIKSIASDAWQFIQGVWDGILAGAQAMITAVGNFFVGLWQGIVAAWQGATAWFSSLFSAAWQAIQTAWSAVISWFQGIWQAIVNAFSSAATWFGNLFTTAWNAIKTAWGAVGSFFSGVWQGVVNVFSGVASWFGNVFNDAWNRVTGIFSGLWSWFRDNVWNRIVGVFGSIGTSIADGVSGAFKGVVNTAINAISGFINGVIGAINSAINVINKIPGVNIGKIGAVSLPRLAKGGIVDSPTTALIGEAGREAVMPLENNTGWITELADKINSANGRNNGQPINLTVQIGEDKVASKIIDLINEKTQMSGRNSILV